MQLYIFHCSHSIKLSQGCITKICFSFRYPILLLVKNRTFPPRTICCDGPKGQHINIQEFTFKILPNLGEMDWHLVQLFIVIDQIYWIGEMLKRKELVNVWKQHFILPKGNMESQDCWILKVSWLNNGPFWKKNSNSKNCGNFLMVLFLALFSIYYMKRMQTSSYFFWTFFQAYLLETADICGFNLIIFF